MKDTYLEKIDDLGLDEERASENISDAKYLYDWDDGDYRLLAIVEYWLRHQEEMPLWGHPEATDAVIAKVATARENQDDSDGDDFYALAAAICETYSCHRTKAPQCYKEFFEEARRKAREELIEEYESLAEYAAEDILEDRRRRLELRAEY